MNKYWDSMSLCVKDILDEISCDGLDGNPSTFPKMLMEKVRGNSLDIFYSENDRNLVFESSATGERYLGVKIGSRFFDVWKRLEKKIFESNDFDGVYLYNSSNEYTRWIFEKEWIEEFISNFKGKCAYRSLKKLKVHVMVQNPVSISELYGLADIIHIHPLDGILYGNRFLLPLNGYINLEGVDETTDSMRESIEMAADLLGIYRREKEAYEDYLHRLQIHIFNYEIRKTEFLADGNLIKDFVYGEVETDVEKAYELASIRGSIGESSIQELAKEFDEAIKHSVQTKNVDNVVDNLGSLYAILLARVKFGNDVDIHNDTLSKITSYDIDKALNYGVKLVELIDKIRKNRFEEKLEIAKYQIEEEKLKMAKSVYDKLPKDDKEDEKKIYEMVADIKDKDVNEFIERGEEKEKSKKKEE